MTNGNRNKTVSDFSADKSAIKKAFEEVCPNMENNSNLYSIFNIALNDLTLFPNIVLSEEKSTLKDYLQKWTDGYNSFILPSNSEKSAKKTCSDPAVKEAVKLAYALDDSQADDFSKIHDVFMAIENVQGGILEEYIASRIEPYGWLWCYGETLRAIDFATKDGKVLLQVKNKNNTENSSSSSIRNGTTIIKWYRLGTKKENNLPKPVYKWETLNKIINDNAVCECEKPCDMNEDDYLAFLKNVIKRNPKLIKD